MSTVFRELPAALSYALRNRVSGTPSFEVRHSLIIFLHSLKLGGASVLLDADSHLDGMHAQPFDTRQLAGSHSFDTATNWMISPKVKRFGASL